VELPTWVTKRDGRLVPFDADKISRSLFAATEALGQPNAFMARELTDGVLHFLKVDIGGATPTTAQLTELVVKVVRELGQPGLAQAYADFPRARAPRTPGGSLSSPRLAAAQTPRLGPTLGQLTGWIEGGLPSAELARRAGRACLRDYSLRDVYTRDLVAAQADRLLTLTGLDSPLELAGWVPGPLPAEDETVIEAVDNARQLAGGVLGIDGPEYMQARSGAAEAGATAAFVRALGIGLRAAGLKAVVNLNCAMPPVWANDLAEGPLFTQRRPYSAAAGAAPADVLLDHWLKARAAPIRIDWHLSERDFEPAGHERLLRRVRQAQDSPGLAFVFDRPRRPVALAEGLDRRHPAMLLTVGLHLAQLLRQGEGASDAAGFLRRLGSLARLALGAGVQKRDFLRRYSRRRPDLTRGFLLDRARLAVAPVGLEAVVRELLGRGLCDGGPGLDFAVQTVQRLREVLEQDGRRYGLETCLDSAADFSVAEPIENPATPAASQAAGLTCWDWEGSPKNQLKAAGSLHALAEAGTAAVLVPPERPLAAEEVVDLLRFGWQHTDVLRLRILRVGPPQPKLTAPWEEDG
jgi:hypothetical protein